MENKKLLDTNFLIKLLGEGTNYSLPFGKLAISFITELELLSWKQISLKEKREINTLIGKFKVFGYDNSIKKRTISTRRNHGLKTPDSIILGTAFAKNYILVTYDKKLENAYIKGF